MSSFQDEKITLDDVTVFFKAHTKDLGSFSFSLSKASLNFKLVADFTEYIVSKLPIPLKVVPDEHSFIFRGLIYGRNSVNTQLTSIIKTIREFYLPAKPETLDALSNQILQGIKKIGFQSTKSQKDKVKHMYLYAINDHCNDCGREWETFPLVLTVKENLLDFRIIFAVDCKPGQFNPKKETLHEEKKRDLNLKQDLTSPREISSNQSLEVSQASVRKNEGSLLLDQSRGLPQNLKKPLGKKKSGFNLEDQVSKKSLKLDTYLGLETSEFKPKLSNFLNTSTIKPRMLFEFLNFSKRFIGNWRFVYDSAKMQVILRYTMKPLYPFHYNLPIPQQVTSEAIIYYTSFAYGLYAIYKHQGSYDEKLLKSIKKTCKQRSKKPIIVFSLLTSNEHEIVIDHQEFKADYNETHKLLVIISKNECTKEILSYSKIKISNEQISFPTIKNLKNFKVFDLESPRTNFKTKKQFFKMINYLASQGYHMNLQETCNFTTIGGKLYYNYSKSLHYLFTYIDEKSLGKLKHHETLNEILESLSVLKLKSDELTISVNDIDYGGTGGKVLNGTEIEIIDLKKHFRSFIDESIPWYIMNEAIKKYVINRCFFEGYTRRYFGILESEPQPYLKVDLKPKPDNKPYIKSGIRPYPEPILEYYPARYPGLIVEKVSDNNKIFSDAGQDQFHRPLKKLSTTIMSVIDRFQNYNNAEIQISIIDVFIYDKNNLKISFDLIVEIELDEEYETLKMEKKIDITSLKEKYKNVPGFILRFLIGLAYKLCGKYVLNIKFIEEDMAKVIYYNESKNVLFKLPKNRYITDHVQINISEENLNRE